MIKKIILTAIIVMAIVGCNFTEPEPVTAEIGFNYDIPTVINQVIGETSKDLAKAAENFTGTLEVYDSDAPTVLLESIAWYASIDEDLFTITSNKTIVIEPGTYNFNMVLSKGTHSYVGEVFNQTLGEGDNTLDLTLNPVIGDTGVEIVTTQLTTMRFNYSDIQYSALAVPRLGYILDEEAEVILDMDQLTGTCEAAGLGFITGSHTLELNLYDGDVLKAKSIDSQEAITVATGDSVQIDMEAFHGEAEFNLALDGGDATFNFTVPAEIIDEAGGVADLQATFQLTSPRNGTIAPVDLTLTQSGVDYIASVTQTGFFYDTVAIALTFTDITDNEVIGSCAQADIDLTETGQSIILNMDLTARLMVSGSLYGFIGVNVFDADNAPVSGANVSLDGNFVGITGATHTAGYLKVKVLRGTYTLSAEYNSNTLTGSEIVTVQALELTNQDITIQ